MKVDELLAQVDYLLHIAGRKCDSWEEAQDLVQATLLEGLLAIRKGMQINNAKNWLCTVLNRKYFDLLREKYRKPLVFFESSDAIWEQESYQPQTDDPEGLTEEENLRRLVAGMTRLYREVIVRYYFHGQGIKEIAEELSLPENTVKSRLRLGRDKLRKELSMEKFEQQSYEPEDLWIASSGCGGMDGQPYSLVKNDKITMNLLILAYEKPVSIPMLADAIGISTTYIEPIVERLVEGELMKQTGDKVYTDFIIFTEKDLLNTFELQKQLADDLCTELWKYVAEGLDSLRASSCYSTQNPSQAAKLEGYFVLHTVYRAVLKVRDEVAGVSPYCDYPYRKDGGRWYAIGTRMPANYNYAKAPTDKYGISGEAGCSFKNFPGARQVGLYDYDTGALGKSHSAYRYAENWNDAREAVTKLLYAVYCDNETFLSGISHKLLENIDTFIALDLLERSADGKLLLNVPVLRMEDKNNFYQLMNEYIEKLSSMFHKEFLKMIKNPVIVPKHIQPDVPGFLRYLNTCCFFPSAFIYNIRERGLFLKNYEKPVPAILMFVDPE